MRSSELQVGQIFKGTRQGVSELMTISKTYVYLGRPGGKDYTTMYDKKYFLSRVKQGKIQLRIPKQVDYSIF